MVVFCCVFCVDEVKKRLYHCYWVSCGLSVGEHLASIWALNIVLIVV